jgi:hypothetical protein
VSTLSPSSSNITRNAWLVVALLMPVALLNYLDRQMLASMKASVMLDIKTIQTEANWGFMLGQFKWVHVQPVAVGAIPDGNQRSLLHASGARADC